MSLVPRDRTRRTTSTGYVDDDLPWLLLAATVGGVVYLAYLATHAHPAYEGGLFLDIVEQVRMHGYGLPERIPGYTVEGVPFAYPPLAFYVLAAAVDLTGVNPVALQLAVPGLVVIVSLVPYYYLARELLGSPRQAGLATVVFAATPAVLRWHLSAGGIVRAPAMFLALAGAYAGVRLFRDRDRRWLVPAVALFGVTVLTHPHYTAFFGVTYLLLFAVYDRTPRGLATGTLVAAGGLAFAAPWWLQVVATHGPDQFLAASGSHSGLLGGLDRVERLFVRPVGQTDPLTPFYLAAYAGGAYAVVRRRFVLPAWMVAVTYVVGKNRFLFVAGAMLVGLVVWEVLVPIARRIAASSIRPTRASLVGRGTGTGSESSPSRRSVGGAGPGARRQRIAVAVVVAAVVVPAAAVGALFGGSALATAHQQSSSLPQTVDSADRDAMEWVAADTPGDAHLLVLGDAAEWYPYYTDRTIVVSPWGNEWTSAGSYYREVALYRTLSTCDGPTCITASLAESDRDPEYVVLPVGEYTVRGKEYRNDERDVAAIAAAEEYRLVHENEGVAVFRVATDIDRRIRW